MCLSVFNQYMRRILSFFLTAMILACLLPSPYVRALDDPVVEKVQSAYLYNIENNQILYELNIHHKIYPASTVKIMTALVAEEKLSHRLDETVTITAQMLNGVTGNHIGLKNVEHSVRNLFYGLLMRAPMMLPMPLPL